MKKIKVAKDELEAIIWLYRIGSWGKESILAAHEENPYRWTDVARPLNGMPYENLKGILYLPADQIKVKSRSDHLKELYDSYCKTRDQYEPTQSEWQVQNARMIGIEQAVQLFNLPFKEYYSRGL